MSFFSTLLFFFAETAAKGGEKGFYDTYLNYPGFEAWRFLNLAIFVGIMIYLLKKPLSKAFTEKRNAIRAELIQAEEAKQAAQLQLDSADEKLGKLSSEKAQIIASAEEEAASERRRLEEEAQLEIDRARSQADTEVSRKTAQVNVQLKRFSAEESVRLAEEKIKSTMDGASDSSLIDSNIEAIGGLK